jgi:hypothetical protein
MKKIHSKYKTLLYEFEKHIDDSAIGHSYFEIYEYVGYKYGSSISTVFLADLIYDSKRLRSDEKAMNDAVELSKCLTI